MSIFFDLETTAEMALDEFAAALFDNLKYEILDRDEEGLVIRTDYFLAKIYPIVDINDSASPCWGSIANRSIYFFNVDMNEEHNGFRQILQITVDWLKETTKDTGLVYYGELPLLIRKNGNLIMNSAWEWNVEDLQLIQLPYETKKLPVC